MLKEKSRIIKKNTISKISLSNIIFEQDEGGGGDGGGDTGSHGGTTSSSDYGGYYDTYGYGGGGGGGITPKQWYDTFVAPVKNLLDILGYATEKTSLAGYFFGKKILVNIPRLLNPATPLIFDEIADEEKAAYLRLDKRYASALDELNKNFNNRDLKAFAFLYSPYTFITRQLITKTPVLAYRLLNTFSGNKLSDFISTVRNEYRSLPSQQRRRSRVAELVKYHEREDRKAAERISGKSSGSRSRSDYDDDSLYESANIFEVASKEVSEETENEAFFSAMPELFLSTINNIIVPYMEPALTNMQKIGKEALENIIGRTEKKLDTIEKILDSETIESYARAAGLNKSKINSFIDKTVDEMFEKIKDDNSDKEMSISEKTMIRDQIENQIFSTAITQLKSQYRSQLLSLREQFDVDFPPSDFSLEIERIRQRIDNLLNKI